MKMTLTEIRRIYQELARAFNAMENCRKANFDNENWYDRHEEKIEYIIKNVFPHGSGIDGKTEMIYEKCNDNRLVFNSEYHCMDENGYYDGWINFRVVITPCLSFGYRLKIIGNFGNYRDIKDYLYEIYSYALDSDFDNVKYQEHCNNSY